MAQPFFPLPRQRGSPQKGLSVDKPHKPLLKGIWTDTQWNRFTWDFDKIPSPMRSTLYPQTTEHVPVICRWCGEPYWPLPVITEGVCSPGCDRDERAYAEERSPFEALQTELDHMRELVRTLQKMGSSL